MLNCLLNILIFYSVSMFLIKSFILLQVKSYKINVYLHCIWIAQGISCLEQESELEYLTRSHIAILSYVWGGQSKTLDQASLNQKIKAYHPLNKQHLQQAQSIILVPAGQRKAIRTVNALKPQTSGLTPSSIVVRAKVNILSLGSLCTSLFVL